MLRKSGRCLGCLLVLLICAAVYGQSASMPQTAPATQTAEEGIRARREAFFRANLVEAYETVGRRNPKWDAPARELLQLAVQRWTRPTDPNLDLKIVRLGDTARAAGCDDPAVLYTYTRARYAMNIYRGNSQLYYQAGLRAYPNRRLSSARKSGGGGLGSGG